MELFKFSRAFQDMVGTLSKREAYKLARATNTYLSSYVLTTKVYALAATERTMTERPSY